MELKKLERIKDSAKFYRVLLTFLSNPVNEDHKLNAEELEVFKDIGMYNQFMEDLAGRIILFNEEEFKNKAPIEEIYQKMFQIESANSPDIKEQMTQIRNCFAHSLTSKKENKIEFDNGKVKGSIEISKLPLVNVLYSSIAQGYKAITDEVETGISFDEAMSNFEVIKKLIEISFLNQRDLLLDRHRTQPLKNIKDLNEFLRRTKTKKITTKDVPTQVKLYEWTKPFFMLIPYEEMSKTAITKGIKEVFPQGEYVKVDSLEKYRDIILGYIKYIGEEKFYNLDYETQTDVILDLIRIEDYERNSIRDNLTNFIIPFEKINRDILQGKTSLSLKQSAETTTDRFLSNYSKPIMFEAVLDAYMYNRLIYLRELLNTEQIDESILDYSTIDISGIDCKVRQSKKEVSQRKQELHRLIDICKTRIESQKKNKQKIDEVMRKKDNPNNPGREKSLQNYNSKKRKLDISIEDDKRILSAYESELEYINTNGKIPVKANTIFRTLRNSTTHGFSVAGRASAYRDGDLSKLALNFEDRESQTSITIRAGRLIKLMQDIEETVARNVERINNTTETLGDAVEETFERVSQEGMQDTITKTMELFNRTRMLRTAEEKLDNKPTGEEK